MRVDSNVSHGQRLQSTTKRAVAIVILLSGLLSGKRENSNDKDTANIRKYAIIAKIVQMFRIVKNNPLLRI